MDATETVWGCRLVFLWLMIMSKCVILIFRLHIFTCCNFLTTWATTNFSIQTLHSGVNFLYVVEYIKNLWTFDGPLFKPWAEFRWLMLFIAGRTASGFCTRRARSGQDAITLSSAPSTRSLCRELMVLTEFHFRITCSQQNCIVLKLGIVIHILCSQLPFWKELPIFGICSHMDRSLSLFLSSSFYRFLYFFSFTFHSLFSCPDLSFSYKK